MNINSQFMSKTQKYVLVVAVLVSIVCITILLVREQKLKQIPSQTTASSTEEKNLYELAKLRVVSTSTTEERLEALSKLKTSAK